MKMFVVGGYVRDLLLDNSPNDSDYVITGSSVQEMELLGLRQVGADFFPDLHNNWDFVNSLLKIMDINFYELSIKQKTELKGPAIAEAIRELRIKFIINKLEELK